MNASRLRQWFGAVALAALALATMPAHADKIGIVLMHGKLGLPFGTSAGREPAPGAALLAALKAAGYLVSTPEMCWSRRRSFDKPYDACLAEIGTEIAALRAEGATTIVVGGHSLGGSAAIAYAAGNGRLRGVIGLAPADDPARKLRRPEIAAAVERARALVAAGKGDERGLFSDVNTGAQGGYTMGLNTTARIYLSFNDPANGIEGNVAKLGVPLLWVAGSEDPTQRNAQAAYFARAPANPLNRYVAVAANHMTTPDAGKDAVLQWLADLQK